MKNAAHHTTVAPRVDVRRGKDRFLTKTGWLTSYHSFSFGGHYDPTNIGHGLLRVSNDDVIQPGSGFQTHPHRDMEIITWVLSGALEHRDSEGNRGVITPGLAQRMSAGRGIWHSEINPSATEPVRLVQMWVLPDRDGIDPGYEQMDITQDLAGGGLIPIASGTRGGAVLSIHQKGATLWAGRLKEGERVCVPEGRNAHVYVAQGDVTLDGAGG